MITTKFSVTLLSLLFIPSLFAQTTIVIQPGPEEGKDAYCWSIDPNINSPNNKDYKAEEWTYYGEPFSSRSLIEFDLTSLPNPINIKTALLSLYYNPQSSSNTNTIGHSSLSGPNEGYLSRIISPWEEFEVTYNTLPDITELNRVTIPESHYYNQDYTDIDITQLVMDALEEGDRHIGIMFEMVVHFHYRRLLFSSSDHPDPNKWPKLEITYDDCLNPSADFEYEMDEFKVEFINTSLEADSFWWDFGDLQYSDEASPVHIYDEYGIYTVCLTAFNECGEDESCQDVRVCIDPIPMFTCEYLNNYLQMINNSMNASNYYWEFDNGLVSFEEEPLIPLNDSLIYNICLTAINECDSAKYCDTIVMAIPDFDTRNQHFRLYPNPANDNIFLEADVYSKNIEVKIYSISGELMLSESTVINAGDRHIINVESFSPGCYSLSVQSHNMNRNFKFIKLK